MVSESHDSQEFEFLLFEFLLYNKRENIFYLYLNYILIKTFLYKFIIVT